MRRELNEIEYLNWCIGQPYNMVVAVQVRGTLPPDRLRRALDQAQQRHPLLRVNTELGPAGIPWFSSEGVGTIPLTVIEQAAPDDTQRLADSELGATFARDQGGGGSSRLPLMRLSLLFPRDPAQPTSVVLTAQHVIADGMSMVFLVRDLLRFIDEPDAPVTVLDAPASPADLLPAKVRRRIPRSPLLFRIVLGLTRVYARLRFGGRPGAPGQRTQRHRTWELTADQTSRLRARCRREAVSVQSAICAAFLTSWRAIHTPVSLRPFLARPVGESVGLFVGSADVRMQYRPASGFWGNARRFHRRLQRALRDPFRIFRLFSKAVPAAAAQQLGRLMVRVASAGRPFAVTNLGQLDAAQLQLGGRSLSLESFFGAVTGIVDSSVLTVYTIGGRMRLHLLASELGPSDTSACDDGARAVRMLLDAAEESVSPERRAGSVVRALEEERASVDLAGRQDIGALVDPEGQQR